MTARTPVALLAAGMLTTAVFFAGTGTTAEAAPAAPDGVIQVADRQGPPPGHMRKAPPPPPPRHDINGRGPAAKERMHKGQPPRRDIKGPPLPAPRDPKGPHGQPPKQPPRPPR